MPDFTQPRAPDRFVIHDAHEDDAAPNASADRPSTAPLPESVPHFPASMPDAAHPPPRPCPSAMVPGAGKTFTIPDSLLERDRQQHLWQSTRWRCRSTGAPSSKTPSAPTATSGSASTAASSGTDRASSRRHCSDRHAAHRPQPRQPHAWHTTRGRPEPWQVHLGEPIDDRPSTRPRGPEAEADTERLDDQPIVEPLTQHRGSASSRERPGGTTGPTAYELTPRPVLPPPMTPGTTKLPQITSGREFGKPETIVQGNYPRVRKGDLNPTPVRNTAT